MAAPRNVREQVKQLVLFNAMYIFLVAKTVNAVHFLEEVGTPQLVGTERHHSMVWCEVVAKQSSSPHPTLHSVWTAKCSRYGEALRSYTGM